MDRNILCFIEMETDVKQGCEFLEKFISIIPDFEARKHNAMKGFVNFDNYKKAPDDIQDDVLYKWLIQNWGCSYIPDIERIEITISKNEFEREYYEEDYEPVFDIAIFNNTPFDKRNEGSMYTIEKNWYNSKEIKSLDFAAERSSNAATIVNAQYDIIKWCKKELSERSDDSDLSDYDPYDVKIKLKINLDQLPMKIFKYWYSEFISEMNIEVMTLDDSEIIDNYEFTYEGFKYTEITYEKNPEKYYIRLMERGCLNFEYVYNRVSEMLEEIYAYEKNDKLTNFTKTIKEALYKMSDNHEMVAKIIVSVDKLYDEYIEKIEVKK